MKYKIKKRFTWFILLALITLFSIQSLSLPEVSSKVDDFLFSVPKLSAQDMFWPGNASDWTEIAPEEQGLNSSKIAEMFEFIKDDELDIHSIIIVRNGYLILYEYLYQYEIYRYVDLTGEHKTYFGGVTLRDQYSTTKSLTSILIGIALKEGFLDNVSQTIYEFYSDIWQPSFINSTLKKNITIKQLLTMNSGFTDSGPNYPPDGEHGMEADFINFTLDKVPLSFTPGEEGEWEYTNHGVDLLSGIIANASGYSNMEEFAKHYLLEPLEISEEEYDWLHDDNNNTYGASGFLCTPKVQAKLGMLFLNNGSWRGEQIVDLNYFKNATSYQIAIPGWIDYGYLFYIMDSPFEGYYTFGALGQCIYVIPEYNITVGFTGAYVDSWDYEQIILDYILQFVEPPGNQIPPEDPAIPGFNLNMIFLMVFCAAVVILIRSKKSSKN